MAKQRLKKPAPLAPLDADEPELLEDEYIPPDLEFIAKRDEYAGTGGGQVNIYREGPGGYKDLTFIRSLDLSEFEPAMLQSQPFNGGRFRIHMRGRSGLLANFLFKVEPLPGAPRPESAAALPAGFHLTLPGAPAQAPTDIVAILGAMNANFEKVLAAVAHPPAAPAVGFEQIMQLVNSVMGRAAAPSILDGVGKLGPLLELIDRVRGDRGGEGGDGIGNALGRALEKLAEPLGQVVAAVAERRAAAAGAAVPALAAPGGAGGVAQPEGTDMQAILKQYAAAIMTAARNDDDPAKYAQLAINFGDQEKIAEFVKQPNWFDTVAEAIPEAIHVRAWFEELHEVMKEALLTPPEPGAKIGETPAPPASSADTTAKN